MASTLTQKEFTHLLSAPSITSSSTSEANKFIVSSPYPDHPLDLTTMGEHSQELAILLQELQANEGYLDLPYEQAFNWSTILPKLSPNFPAKEFYLVAFRSRLATSAVCSELLFELYTQDKLSHLEANESGGLLKYWFGPATSDRRNLSTCVWINQDWALKASELPQHSRAKNIVRRGVYETWIVETYKLHIGGSKEWRIEKIA